MDSVATVVLRYLSWVSKRQRLPFTRDCQERVVLHRPPADEEACGEENERGKEGDEKGPERIVAGYEDCL